jgi:hypothetical protein
VRAFSAHFFLSPWQRNPKRAKAQARSKPARRKRAHSPIHTLLMLHVLMRAVYALLSFLSYKAFIFIRILCIIVDIVYSRWMS